MDLILALTITVTVWLLQIKLKYDKITEIEGKRNYIYKYFFK